MHGYTNGRGKVSLANSLNPTYARSFQALELSNLYALGQDGNFGLEHGLFNGFVQPTPPPLELVDQKVRAFQAIDANNVFGLGDNSNLWLEHSADGKFGQNLLRREQADRSCLPGYQGVRSRRSREPLAREQRQRKHGTDFAATRAH